MSIDKNVRGRVGGQSVIEVVIAVAIFVILASGAITAVLGSLLTSRQAAGETQAAFLAVEGLSGVESIRNRDWSYLIGGVHGLSNSGGAWALAGTSETLGKFTRTITIADVPRDEQFNIVSGGGVSDPNTKRITSTVSWNFIPAKTSIVELTTYLTNWQESSNVVSGEGSGPASCEESCQIAGYSVSVCRANANQCSNNGESNVPGGDSFCTGGANADTCCCR